MSSNNNITDNRVTLNGVKVYPFRSFDELLAFAEKQKGILVSINAEKILHATDETRGIINRNIGIRYSCFLPVGRAAFVRANV